MELTQIISILVYLVIIVHIVFHLFERYRKKEINTFDYLLSWYAFIYAFIPILMIISPEKNTHNVFKSLDYNPALTYESLIALIAYIFLQLGNKFYNGKGYVLTVRSYTKKYLYVFSLILFFLSVVGFVYFIYSYGGLTYVLSNISSVRSGTSENKDYIGAFFNMFSKYLMYSFFIQLFLWYKGYFKKRYVMSFIFFTISLLLILKTFVDGGRAGIISVFIYIALAIFFLKGKINKKVLAITAFLSLFIIVFGKTYLFALFDDNINISFQDVSKRQSEIGFINLLVREFNHQTITLANFTWNDYESRFFKDYFIWILKPMKLFGGGQFYDSISYYNTFLIQKNWSSDIPPGFIAMAYLNGGIFAVVLQSFILGRLFRIIDMTFYNSDFKNNGILFFLYLYLFGLTWFAMQNGDIALIIQSSLVFIILIIYMFLSGRIKLLKRI